MHDAADLVTDPDRRPRQMAELTDLLVDELTRGADPLDLPAARHLAGRLMVRIAREYGGSLLYWPKADALDRLCRDARMWADFDGTYDGPGGVEALARRENITVNYAYRIIARQRDLHRRSVQSDLFAHLTDNNREFDPMPFTLTAGPAHETKDHQ